MIDLDSYSMWMATIRAGEVDCESVKKGTEGIYYLDMKMGRREFIV
jgi:hypothetical protein